MTTTKHALCRRRKTYPAHACSNCLQLSQYAQKQAVHLFLVLRDVAEFGSIDRLETTDAQALLKPVEELYAARKNR